MKKISKNFKIYCFIFLYNWTAKIKPQIINKTKTTFNIIIFLFLFFEFFITIIFY